MGRTFLPWSLKCHVVSPAFNNSRTEGLCSASGYTNDLDKVCCSISTDLSPSKLSCRVEALPDFSVIRLVPHILQVIPAGHTERAINAKRYEDVYQDAKP